MEKIVLIDGNSLLHRAFHALPLLETKKGRYTNAVYGFVTMLLRLLDEEKPDYLLVAFDKGKKTFRHKMYAEYKGTRKKSAPELAQQFATVREVMDALGIPYVEMDEYEADDILGAYAKKAASEGKNALIVTGDRDALQLVDDNIQVLYTKRGISQTERCDIAFIDEKYGIKPEQLIDVKSLMGDNSDNIPGVPGVGEKTALKLIKAYGNLEGVYEHLGDVSGKKLLENLTTFKQQAELSYELGQIATNIENLEDLADYRFTGLDKEKAAALFQELEFTSLVKKMGMTTVTVAQAEEKRPTRTIQYKLVTIEDIDEWREFMAERKSAELGLALVCEQTRTETNIKKIQIFDGKTLGEFVPFMPMPGQAEGFIRATVDSGQRIISLQAKTLLSLCKMWDLELPLVDDVSLMAYLLDAEAREYTEETLIANYLDVKLPSNAEHWAVLANYLSFPLLQKALEEEGLLSLYEDLELPLLSVLCDMERHGVRVDLDYLSTMRTKLLKTIEAIESEIYENAGERFNINSPKQLSKILFETLELTPLKKTKTGYSTDAEVLDKLKDDHPIVSLVLDYRKWVKLNSTYVEGLLEQGSRKDGIIHTSYNQTVASTGRLSSTDPNLQNIPIRTEESKLIRRAFKPVDDGNILMAADYSQIELRVLAHLSKDEKMTQAYIEDKDIHTATASEVFDIPMEMVNKAMRRKAKAVNFGIVYGISDFGLARDLNIPVYEAKEYIETYFERYPGVKRFIDETIAEAKASGEVRTMLNRKRRIRNINSSNFNARSGAERMAMNTPVQGSAADIIKIAMLKVDEALKKEKLKARMILQVHDEIILELPKEELEAATDLLRRCMEDAYKLSVPLKVDMKSGTTWYDMEGI